MALTIKAIRDPERLANRRDDWQALADQANEPNPFFEPWNVLPALSLPENASAEAAPIHVFAYEGSRMVGYVPFRLMTGYARLPVPYLSTWQHDQSFFGGPLILPGYEQAFLEATLEWADTSRDGTFIQWFRIDMNGPFAACLSNITKRQSYQSFSYKRAALASEDDFDTYLGHHIRGKKRKELRRLRNRLDEEGQVRFETLREASDLKEWTSMFMDLEDSSWKGDEGTSLRASAGTRHFFRDAIDGSFKTGKLLFQRLMLDEKPLAMLVNFISDGVGYSYKIAYSSDYSRYSPGVMIELDLMEQTLDGKVALYMDSCAKENHPMINHLWAERREIGHFNISLKTSFGGPVLTVCRKLESLSARKQGAV